MRARIAYAAVVIFALAACGSADYFQLEPTTVTLESLGAERTIKAIAKNRQGQEFPKEKPEQWVSSDEKVVKVSSDGKLSPVGSGTATVKAIRGDLVGEAIVEVILVEKFEVEPAEIALTEDGDPVKPKIRVVGPRGKLLEKRMITARCKDEKICHTDKDNQLWPGAVGETTAEYKTEGHAVTVKVVVAKGKK